MPTPKTPQQEIEEQKQRAAEEQAKRDREKGQGTGREGPSESSKVGEHTIDPENKQPPV